MLNIDHVYSSSHGEEVYQKLKAPKKYPNAVTELLELFESAYALTQEVYDIISSH